MLHTCHDRSYELRLAVTHAVTTACKLGRAAAAGLGDDHRCVYFGVTSTFATNSILFVLTIQALLLTLRFGIGAAALVRCLLAAGRVGP